MLPYEDNKWNARIRPGLRLRCKFNFVSVILEKETLLRAQLGLKSLPIQSN